MKHLAFFFLVFPWKILTFDDFKMKDPQNPCHMAARSNITLSFDYEEDYYGRIHFTSLSVFFNPDSSFMLFPDEYILNHEQQHLNLAQFIANKFNKENAGKVFSAKKWYIIHKEVIKEWSEMDIRYDQQSEHSVNKKMQAKWDEFLKTQLQ